MATATSSCRCSRTTDAPCPPRRRDCRFLGRPAHRDPCLGGARHLNVVGVFSCTDFFRLWGIYLRKYSTNPAAAHACWIKRSRKKTEPTQKSPGTRPKNKAPGKGRRPQLRRKNPKVSCSRAPPGKGSDRHPPVKKRKRTHGPARPQRWPRERRFLGMDHLATLARPVLSCRSSKTEKVRPEIVGIGRVFAAKSSIGP